MAKAEHPLHLKAKKSSNFEIKRNGKLMELHAVNLSPGSGTHVAVDTGIKLYLKPLRDGIDPEVGTYYLVQFIPAPVPGNVTECVSASPIYNLGGDKDKPGFRVTITLSDALPVNGRLGYLVPVSIFPATKDNLDNG